MREPSFIPRGACGHLWVHERPWPVALPHRHDDVEVNLVLRGRARHLLDGAT